jgi:rhodanese-related sulfurtransferase
VRYFDQGHLPGARQIAHDKIDAAVAAAAIPDKSTEVVLYCASATCANSDQAAKRLTQLGYENVKVYKGGKADWADAGWSLFG